MTNDIWISIRLRLEREWRVLDPERKASPLSLEGHQDDHVLPALPRRRLRIGRVD
ncbi:hypothetical protein [Neorhizobium galegae]|uniref:hypothetical protein n=1 Tax=Neorhizobium galegae TaxID=399 RepID=UPI000A6A9AEB|nr:hypothetical protein [Neorhizobium galegae]MCM2501025.1 hypothetical protein [Neorhizobium galegae]MCQ1769665.1 hypothetical protein [Neorhizobium galegae]MCQ1770918.1 hypothetical protein [Neorhizobium galegae]MCQ1780219.1 hypothetical protein [Neorhizobium galegae]MCQ1797031.1 hypothetical protein [Neorhizobium galegae]